MKTVDAIAAELAVFTDEQRSLAWSPQPPPEPTGGSDCRPGGDCGLNFDFETRLSKWRQARFRWNREQRAPSPKPCRRHDFADGDVCSHCDQIKPLRRSA